MIWAFPHKSDPLVKPLPAALTNPINPTIRIITLKYQSTKLPIHTSATTAHVRGQADLASYITNERSSYDQKHFSVSP
jgi:hypothetical protein